MNNLTDFKATIGLDWADRKHDLWVRPADGSKPRHLQLEQTPEAIHEWIAQLRQRFPEGQVAVAIETSRGPVLSALRAYDFIVIFAINPKGLKDYRAAFCVSGAKNDRTDAQLLEEMLRLHADKLRAIPPDTELTRKLGGFTQARRAVVDQRTRLINQTHATLKTYYPLAEAILGSELNTPMAAQFLARWPDLQSLQAAQPETLRRFFHQHNCRSSRKVQERLQAIRNAQPLTTDPAIIEPARALVSAWAAVLRCLHKSIAALDQQIQQAMDQHPDAALFRSLPGAGPALAPRLLVAFGSQRDRFQSAQEVAQFYGIAPVLIQSGNSHLVRLRHRCPKFGRQTFHENAACAAKSEAWAKSYYRHHRQKHDDKHHQACRALAYKLIRIYFACWKNRTQYRTQNYLAALQRSGSRLSRVLNHSDGE